ncbi:MAG: hypothetical protein JO297_08085 [Nitrososphaeraceae archaeon]|nr:hypothetical protein [Nitrososphaeraceae archaeon]
MPLNKSWHDYYNESLIERGRILMDIISFLGSSKRGIKAMNKKGKLGAPFEYSRTYIQFLAFLKVGFKIFYRPVQGHQFYCSMIHRR